MSMGMGGAPKRVIGSSKPMMQTATSLKMAASTDTATKDMKAAADGTKGKTVPSSQTVDNLQPMIMKNKYGLPQVGCMPGCTKDHKHTFEYDYTKNHWDPMDDRPGYFKDFNWELVNKTIDYEKNKPDSSMINFETTG